MSFETEVVLIAVRSQDGRPVTAADVVLFDQGSFQETTGRTDGLGVFSTFVRSSRYTITISAGGFRDWILEVGIGGSLFERTAVMIPSVTPPDPPVDPPIVVNVAIHVKTQSGAPIVNAAVNLAGQSKLTNSSGIALFQDLGISFYSYSVIAEGFNNASGTIDLNNIQDLTVTLTPIDEPPLPPAVEYTLTVRVSYTDGSPASSVAVNTIRIEGGYSNAGLTNSSGVIVFRNALMGTYRVIVGTDQQEISLDANKTVNFTIESPPTPPNPPTQPEVVPVQWFLPPSFSPGIHEWSIKFDIIPIPFISNWIAALAADPTGDQARLDQLLLEQGGTGTATILEKTVTTTKNFLGAVNSYTITYKVDLQGTFTARASLFPFAALIPFIPALIGLAQIIIVALIVNNVTSTIKKVTDPSNIVPLALLLVGGVVVATQLKK